MERASACREWTALKNMGTRTVARLISLSSMLIQADRFGTSIAQALRVHARHGSRVHRQHAAEEMAAKASVKMDLPAGAVHLPRRRSSSWPGPTVYGLMHSRALFQYH